MEKTDTEALDESSSTTALVEVIELSLNSVVGLTPTTSYENHGKDSRSSSVVNWLWGDQKFHCCIIRVKIAITQNKNAGYLIIGKGQAVQGVGICKGVILSLQNLEIMKDFLPLD